MHFSFRENSCNSWEIYNVFLISIVKKSWLLK